MKNNYFSAVVSLILMTSGINLSQAQSGPQFVNAQVHGTIKSLGSEGIEKVYVTLTSPTQFYPTVITQEDGMYSFNDVVSPELVTVRPVRNDNHRNGISTLDLVRILRHMLGGNVLTSPYQLIAADANNSGNLSVIDIIELRKLILGIYTELPNNTSWRFFPEEHVLADTLPPSSYTGAVEIFVDTEPVYTVNFVGIKIGDINHTAQPFDSGIEIRTSLPAIRWHTEQQEFKANDIIEIDFAIKQPALIHGFQFTVSSTHLEFLNASSGVINLSEENFALFGDKTTFSWYDEAGINLSAKDIVFTLKARAKSNGNLKESLSINSTITEAEVYSAFEEIFVPRLIVNDNIKPVLEVFSAEPNPWKETTTFSFNNPEDGEVLFELFDLNGKRIYNISEFYKSGQQYIHLNSKDFDERGLLICSITSRSMTISNKIIVLD